jgi:hypothetical protein
MIDPTDLDAAVAAGLLSTEQRDRLAELARRRRSSAPGADEEQFRFIASFNDIFVTIAAVLVLVAVATIGDRLAPEYIGSGVAVAAASWALAEYFARRRRMAFPSIVLLLSFVGGAVTAGAGIARSAGLIGQGADPASLLGIAGAASLGVVAALAHWRRFGVPITVAAGAAAAVATAAGAVAYSLHDSGLGEQALRNVVLGVASVGGLGVFALAMRYDMSDRERATRRTDIAFWLHLLAAPLIVHPLFVLLGLFGGPMTTGEALAVIGIYAALTIVALAIDRRALLVSALAYVVYAIVALFGRTGAVDLQVAMSYLVIGVFLVMLSAAWRRIRARVMALVPGGWAERLPVSAAA